MNVYALELVGFFDRDPVLGRFWWFATSFNLERLGRCSSFELSVFNPVK